MHIIIVKFPFVTTSTTYCGNYKSSINQFFFVTFEKITLNAAKKVLHQKG